MIKVLKLFLLFFISLLISCNNGDHSSYLEGSGIIETTNVIIGSQVASKVLTILKEEGTHISAGDTIIILDHITYGFQLKNAEAAVDIARSQLNLILSGARKEDIRQVEETLNQAQIRLNQAEEDFMRMENLYKSQTITKKQYDDARRGFDIARSQFEQSKENYNKIVTGARPEEKEQARANLHKAETALDIIKKQYSDCYVISPQDGYLINTFVEEGETVPLFSSLFKVSNLSTVKLTIYIPETELGKIKLNQSADIFTDTYSDQIFKGRVYYISPEAEFTPKNIQTKDERTRLVYAVKIEIPNPTFELKDGMPADAKIYFKQEQSQ